MAGYIAAEALDSDGEPIKLRHPRKPVAVSGAKRPRASRKARSKKPKLDIVVESDDQDDDFTTGSSESESSDESTDIEVVSNAEVRNNTYFNKVFCTNFKAVSSPLSFQRRLSQQRVVDLDPKSESVLPQKLSK